jgi:chlorobactene glucosyltransferase
MFSLLLLVWCVLTVQTIANLLVFRSLEKSERVPASRVSIVIPARNEERYVGKTLDTALGQDYPDFEVIVVDDSSTDGTAEEIRKRNQHPKLVTASARPLRPGWLGKPNALATGASRATGAWILFMDADVTLDPRALRDAVGLCESRGYDFLALFPQFEREGFWEELLMPIVPVAAFVYLPSYLAYLRRVPLAAGAGAFALVKREAYESIGGHDAIKSSVVDDIRLAIELKRAGFVTRARLGLDRARLRMYHGLSEIVEGFTKNAHAGLGRSSVGAALFLIGSIWVGLTPFLWPFVPSSAALGASLGLLLFCRALVQLRLRFPLWPIFLSPLTTLVALFIVLRSLRMARVDGVVRWRGREYPRETTEF